MKPRTSVALFCAGSAAALLMTGCLDESNPLDINEQEYPFLFVYQTDYSSATLNTITTDTRTESPTDVSVYTDATLRADGGYLYIIEKKGADVITKMDPGTPGPSGISYQMKLGDDWNPHDIEIVTAQKGYISNYDVPKITKFNPQKGKTIKNIDISAFGATASSPSPHASQMVLVDSILYVILQRLDGFTPVLPTLIVPINTSNDSILVDDTLSCNFMNGHDIIHIDGALYVTHSGSMMAYNDGGIDRIDLKTGTVETVIDAAKLGGDPTMIMQISGTRAYLGNAINWGNVQIVEIDLGSGTVIETLPDITDAFGEFFYDAATELLYVPERRGDAPGVKIFKDGVLVDGPIYGDQSLPPLSMVVVR